MSGSSNHRRSDRPLALSDLVGDVDSFASAIWGLSAFRHRCPRPIGQLRALLDVEAIDTMLDSTWRTPLVRMVRAERRGPDIGFTRRVRIAGRDLDDVADAGAVRERFAAGETVVLQGLQRTWPPLRRTALALEAELDHPVQINAYLSPPGAAGLRRHSDVHDVFALQIAGTKTWDVERLGEARLEAGDVLYLPRGTAHEARTDDAYSLHLTIGVPAITYRDAIRRLVDAVDVPALDQPLPLGFTARPWAVHEGLADGLVGFARAADADALIAAGDREIDRAQRRRPVPDGGLAGVVAAFDVDERTVLQRRNDVDVLVEPALDEQGRRVLRIGTTRVLRLPASTTDAVRRAVDGRPVCAGDLPTLTVPGAVVLLRRLTHEGVLMPLPALELTSPG